MDYIERNNGLGCAFGVALQRTLEQEKEERKDALEDIRGDMKELRRSMTKLVWVLAGLMITLATSSIGLVLNLLAP